MENTNISDISDDDLLNATQEIEQQAWQGNASHDGDSDSELLEATQELTFCVEHGLEDVLEDYVDFEEVCFKILFHCS